jgi:hypothetical protein
MIQPDELDVAHLPEQGRFEIRADHLVAELNYSRLGDTITFLHTGVPPEWEGRGVGSKLVKTGLEYAKANGLRIKSLCWFVSGYLKRHPEYQP